MIRWLSKDEWKNFIENDTCVGNYISHETVNTKVTPREDKYHFPNTVIKVKVRQKNSKNAIDLYFNNNGVVKVQGDIHDEFDESAEYSVYYSHPHLINVTTYFLTMMIKKFGVAYLIPRATHCKEEIEECITDIPFHINDSNMYLMLYGKINTNCENINKNFMENKFKLDKRKIKEHNLRKNLQTIYPELEIPLSIPQKRAPIDELVDKAINYEIKYLKEEMEYVKDYIELQESFLDYLAYEYTVTHNNASAIVNYEK